MPLDPIAQEFWPKYNYGNFARKLVDSIFRGPRHNWKNLSQENKNKNKNSIECCSVVPLGPTSQEFWLEYNFGSFALKLVDNIFRGPRTNWKNLLSKKKKKLDSNLFHNPPWSP